METREKVLLTSIFLLLLLIAVKLLGFTLTGSGLLFADALHSTVDLLPVVITLLAFIAISRFEREKKFPTGIYKLENLAAILIAILVYAGIFEAVTNLDAFSTVNKAVLPFVLAALVLEFLLFHIQHSGAAAAGSRSLKAIALHSLADFGSTLAIAISAVLESRKLAFLVLLALLVLIFKETTECLTGAVLSLLDIPVKDELYWKIHKKIQELLPGGMKIKELLLWKAGSIYLGEVVIEAAGKATLATLASLRREVLRSMPPEVKALRVLFEPRRTYEKVAIPLKEGKFSEKFGEATELLIVDFKTGKKMKVAVKEKPKIKKGFTLAKILEDAAVDAVIVRKIGSIAKNELLNYGIDVMPYEEAMVDPKLGKLFQEVRE